MELFTFGTAETQLRELYSIEMEHVQFENMAYIAWEKIGNKLYTLKTDLFEPENGLITLPDGVNQIEAVYINTPDYPRTSNMGLPPRNNEAFIEGYIECRKWQKNDLYTSGMMIPFTIIGENQIKVPENYPEVLVLYKIISFDENGLPLINSKEVDAIAAYCAYSEFFKKSLQTRDQATFSMAQMLEQKWAKLCDHARTPISISENDFNAIGDVKYSWDRKSYGVSFKPIKR